MYLSKSTNGILKFFFNLGFNFNQDLKIKLIEIEKNPTLSNKLKDSILYYKSPQNTNTSFYLITSVLEKNEIQEVRKYIWNKNDANLIFCFSDEETLELLYAKYSPKVSYNDSKLDTFSTTVKDLNKLDQIKRWKFDSGVFWTIIINL